MRQERRLARATSVVRVFMGILRKGGAVGKTAASPLASDDASVDPEALRGWA
jgi:hypothetical protein